VAQDGETDRGSRVETVSALFTDLVGSTELRARAGEESADQLRRIHDSLVIEAIEANGGRVVKSTGDGAIADRQRGV
jgi:class 3 adenylate cyclase